MQTVILDSNILVKLVANEPGSDEVRKHIEALLEGGSDLYTVDLALLEALNALWKHAKLSGDLDESEALNASEDLIQIYTRLNILESKMLYREVLELALSLNITVYDALYIAATRKLGAKLYTADRRLRDIASRYVIMLET
ncbi:type II toxin-antitoxin system VapC family toxin [Candidatus Bathyarchaeota archaeon]|nr:type II toxin-antitoxin system VapC family toxin [Candidatus Bathyarchaeota archaeon]MBS7618534.1 type II toxin-antitoxin system VapC family toxin [Candidatus Bathyarchaeota archaeon]